MNKCKDCKHNKNISCLVCIKDKIYYVGIDLGKGDNLVYSGNGILEQAKIMKPIEGKIDIRKINREFRREIIRDYMIL